MSFETRTYFSKSTTDVQCVLFLNAHSPGRFFAVTMMKMIMAHLLLNYDIKAIEDGVRPKNITLGSVITPDPRAKLLIRKREPKE